jgi:hypothetical protein
MKLLVVGLALAVCATQAAASSRICTSADTLLFGNRTVGSSTTLHSTVSNCGDASFAFTGVSVHTATGPDYRVDTTCATGQTLAPGATCSIDVTFAPRVPGQTSGALWLHNTTSTPDQLVTFYGRGVDAQAGSAVIDFSPPLVQFAATPLGQQAGPITALVRNAGTTTLVPSALVINGPAAYDFSTGSSGDPADCAVGAAIAPGAACRMNFFFRPVDRGVRSAELVIDAPQLAGLTFLNLAGEGAAVSPPAIDVVEFHNAADGQYFITADPAEIAFLDGGGLGTAWSRTGMSFKAWARDDTSAAGSQPVCRFFGTPGLGPNSHFYTANAEECAAVRADPHWQDEGVAFRARVPTGLLVCGGGPIVFRLWFPGTDPTGSRHRYVVDSTLVAPMVDAGWILEGPVLCPASN